MLHTLASTMTPRPDLALFAHIVSRPEDTLDLAQVALLIAECEYKNLDIARYLRMLDNFAEDAERAIQKNPAAMHSMMSPSITLEALLSWMYEQAGFQGNTANYYDPKNSYLNQVLERRTGIPITLAVILIEIGRRLKLDLRGVSFPGHFLARMESPQGPEIIDPFNGRILSREDLRTLYTRATGRREEPETRHLEPAGKYSILLRILNNLSGIYSSRADSEKLCEILLRMNILAPSPEIRQRISVLGGTPYWPTKNDAVN